MADLHHVYLGQQGATDKGTTKWLTESSLGTSTTIGSIQSQPGHIHPAAPVGN